MKLDSPSRFTSFYESFSDLIFATMAIFVLLIVIFLPLIKSTDDSKELQEKLEKIEKRNIEQSKQLAEAEFERDNIRKQLDEITEELIKRDEALRAQGLDLVVAVDISGSMGEALGHLVETIKTIARVLPKITPKFRLSIIGYRKNQVDESLTYFNMNGISSEEKDGGKSLSNLDQFLSKLEAKNGLAPIGWAIDESLKVFSRYSASKEYGDSYKIFFLLGDIGPYEIDWEDMAYTPQKRRYENQITDKITNWVKKSDKHRVISLFSGNPPGNKSDTVQYDRYRESLRFFKDVATKAGQPENFTQNPGKMLAYLLTAIVKKE